MRKLALLILFSALSTLPAFGQSTITGNSLNVSLALSNCPFLNLNIPFSCQLTATGGVATGSAYTWSETGTLPTGLTLTSGGLLSGTPASSSAFPVTFKATDNVSNQSQISVTLQAATLTGTGPCGTAVCVFTGIGSVNTSSTLQLQAVAYFSGLPTNFVDVSSLASWSCTTGAGCTGSSISGVGLFTAGTTTGSATAQATFSAVSGTATVTVVSTATNPIITYPTTTLPNGQIYQAYSEGVAGNSPGQGVQLVASGGTPPYTWTVSAGGPLPTGLSLSSSGLISGTATASGAGVSTTFQVADSALHSNTVVISGGITVASVSSVTANLAQSSIPANTSTNVSALGTYSDSTPGIIPAGMGGAVAYGTAVGTSGSGATNIQVATATATTTGDFAIGIAMSWVNSSCTGYSASITSPNETFSAATVALGQSGVPPPYYNCYQMFYAQNITGNAADRPTCNWTATAGGGCLIRYYHGMLTASTLDQHPAPTQATNVSACTPNSVTTTQASELVGLFCGVNSATSVTPPAGFTATALVQGGSLIGVLGEAPVGTIQTGYVPVSTITPATNEVTLIATFKATSPANGSVTWASDNTNCATVASSTGVVTGLPVTTSCTAHITPTYTGSGSPTITAAQVTVTPNNSVDTGIIVSPSSAFASLGGSQQFAALGNVTGNAYSASWGSSNTSIVPNPNPATGTTTTATCAPGGSGGTVNINATVSGFTSASASFTCTTTSGQIITAAGCDRTSVSNALPTSAQVTSPTITVIIPSCPSGVAWTSALTYSVPSSVTNMTIQGSTTVTCTGAAGTSSYACTPTDNTVLIDSVVGAVMLNFGVGSSTFRLTGITFQGGSVGSSNGKSNGFVTFGGASVALRVDHNRFNQSTYTPQAGAGLTVLSTMNGVFDHNVCTMNGQSNCVRYYPEINGFTAWSQPTAWGTSNFIFAENNVFNGGFANDCDNGGRQVFRYNTVIATPNNGDSGAIQTHNTGQGVPTARLGCRTLERYHNYYTNPTPSTSEYAAGDNSSGPGIAWGETIGAGYSHDLGVYTTGRLLAANDCGSGQHSVGACSAPPNGYGYCGSGSTGVLSVWDGDSDSTGFPCLTGPGRGQGNLLSGDFPNTVNTTTNCVPTSPPGCSVWPHQMREPIYIWNQTCPSCNSIEAVQTFNGVTSVANRDYYVQVSASPNSSPTSPFNGTVGTGFGPFANRPTTCAAGPGGAFGISPTGSYGVGYFATDANGGNGVLYVCTASNTWTQIYTPYTYPHPLDH